jgi:hypothetical protein
VSYVTSIDLIYTGISTKIPFSTSYDFSRKEDLNPTLYLDGKFVNMTKAYNSRALPHPKTFLGYYYDATSLPAETSIELAL